MWKKLVSFITVAVMLISIVGILKVNETVFGSEEILWNRDFYGKNSIEIIVGLKDRKASLPFQLFEVVDTYEAEIVDVVSAEKRNMAIVVKLASSSLQSFLHEIYSSNIVSYIEPNIEWKIQFEPNDEYWQEQWAPVKVKANWAWNTTLGNDSILVAVIDTGIDYNHPDLQDNYVPLGYDWINDDNDPMDDEGHGTHCAGIIAASINNSIGIAGLAQVRIMAEKGLNSTGYGTTEALASSIIHAVDQGANILSMSWGSYFNSTLMYEAIRYAYERGVLLVAAAGNEDTSAKLFPAAFKEVIGVTATNEADRLASFSNYGYWVELAAPGVDIYSTYPHNSYVSASGTSMACPHVAGVAALTWSKFPNKTRDWIRLRLRYTTVDLGEPSFDDSFGYGRINAQAAVEQAVPIHDMAIYHSNYPPYVEPGNVGVINVSVINFGESIENDVQINLWVNNELADSQNLTSISPSESLTLSLSFTPQTRGWYNITISIVAVPGENSLANNIAQKNIHVARPYKIVVVDSEGNVAGPELVTWDKLNEEWHNYGEIPIFIDYTSLRKDNISYEDIVSTEADALIVSSAWTPELGFEFTDSEIEAIKRFVEEGHGFIITEASFCYRVPNNRKLASLVGIDSSQVWNYTDTAHLLLLEPDHPIFNGIPDPFYFTSTNTGVPVDGAWDENELAGGKYLAKESWDRGAIVSYKRGRLYIAPWLEGIDPYVSSSHLRLLYNALTWSPHELAASLEASQYVYLGSSVLINATAHNIGSVNETDVTIQLIINGSIVDSHTIAELPENTSYTLNYLWTPTEGVYNITVRVNPVLGETFLVNNTVSSIVKVTENRDVAITAIAVPSGVFVGKDVLVNVTASNLGEFVETFNVTIYYNSSIIGTQVITELTPNTNITLTFVWATGNLTPGEYYFIYAETSSVEGEANLENNVKTSEPVLAVMLGDVNKDRKIDILDVVAATSIYGGREGDPNWNPDADVTEPWGVIDILDVVVITSKYGTKY